MTEEQELLQFLAELEDAEFGTSTVTEFKRVGESMIAAGMIGVACKLSSLKAAMANEYGD